MSNYIPFDIQTEAGKRLWRTMNRHHGSVVWGPVGDGIVEIEAEMRNTGATRDYYAGMTEGRIQERERIIKLLEEPTLEGDDMTVLHCEKHGWWIEEDELCPVCEGIALERARIIKLLDNYTMYRFEKQWVVDLIEKETE